MLFLVKWRLEKRGKFTRFIENLDGKLRWEVNQILKELETELRSLIYNKFLCIKGSIRHSV